MKPLVLVPLFVLLGGCVIADVAETAVAVVSLPVKVASAGVDAATTSQAEADAKRGREMREEEERLGREARRLAERCRTGKAQPGEICPASPRD